MLPARVRTGAGWIDACILNVSSGGLLIHAECPAQPGSQVELRRGGRLVIGRVVWRSNHRIGVCSAEPVPVEDLISSETVAAAVPGLTGAVRLERRKQPSDPDRSRLRARAAEFLSLALVGIVFAGAAAVIARQALEQPLAAVSRALGPG